MIKCHKNKFCRSETRLTEKFPNTLPGGKNGPLDCTVFTETGQLKTQLALAPTGKII